MSFNYSGLSTDALVQSRSASHTHTRTHSGTVRIHTKHFTNAITVRLLKQVRQSSSFIAATDTVCPGAQQNPTFL